MMLDILVRENTAFTTTGRKAVIAGGTGAVTHQTPIQSTVPKAILMFKVSPAKGIKLKRNSAGPNKRHIVLRLMALSLLLS